MKFWIWSNELYCAPTFEAYDTESSYTWSWVKQEVRTIYPSIPDQAWDWFQARSPNQWLDAAAAFYSDFEHVQVFLHLDMNGQSSASHPWEGRALQLRLGGLSAPATNPTDPTTVVTSQLAHELGHYFGLTHPWGGLFGAYAVDPSTGAPFSERDDWDFLHCTDTFPYRTFPSEAYVASCPAGLAGYIAGNEGSCETKPAYTGRLMCERTWSPDLDATTTGLAFEDMSAANNPPASFRFGINLMMYYGPTNTDRRAPAFLSPSQLVKLDKFLSYDSGALNLSGYLTSSGAWPTGYNATPAPPNFMMRWVPGVADRRTLWTANGVSMDFSFTASTLEELDATLNDVVAGDFDGDGRDDLLGFSKWSTAVKILWGDGHAQLLPNFFTSSANFTRVFVGDFDGDQRDDVFVYGAGALSDYIRYGNVNQTFTTQISAVSGTYLPVVGDFDGNFGDDIFWYHAGGGYVHRWYSNGNRTFQQLNFYSVDAGGPYTPIVGNFDGASGDDIFWYVAGPNQDRLWYSNGTTGFYKVASTNVSGVYAPAAGDFDHDGRADIYWHNTTAERDFIWPGRPQATQFGSSIVSQMYWQRTPVAGDFNGDGRADLFWK